MVQNKDYTDFEISEIVGLIRERSQGSIFAGISMYALGGRVSEVGIDDTAFFYRKAHYIIWLDTIWEEPRYAEDNREWISDRFPCFESLTTGSYVNFPYGMLPDYLEEYYGCHACILKKIKTKYDPLNIFSFPQGIRESDCDYYFTSNCEKLTLDNTEDTLDQLGDVNYRGFRYVSKKI